MIRMIAQRFFHAGKVSMAATRSSALAKLRKSTGYSVSNCKKALEMFPGDVTKAEEWLHAEAKNKGWAKWAKAQSRTAAQGLIGVCTRDNIGVIVEVNCETDFVARNAEFQQLFEKMISGCMSFAENLSVDNNFTKSVLDEAQLSAIKCETASLGELLVAATCKFSEKTVAKRAVCLKVEEDILLSSFSHPSTECPTLKEGTLGKYGVLLALKRNNTDVIVDLASIKSFEDLAEIGPNICQHIIGMNPSSVGELTDKDIQKFTAKEESADEALNTVSENTDTAEGDFQKDKAEDSEGDFQKDKAEDSEDGHVEGEEDVDTTLKESDEVRLLFQPYLLDSNITTGEVLFKSGLEVLAFERFECGESKDENAHSPKDENAQSPEIAQSVGA